MLSQWFCQEQVIEHGNTATDWCLHSLISLCILYWQDVLANPQWRVVNILQVTKVTKDDLVVGHMRQMQCC